AGGERMVDDRGQTFTLESIAAAMLILLATYALFQSSLVISPMWSEFSDAQLKQKGQDALTILDGDKEHEDSLKGMLVNLNSSYRANEQFLASLDKTVNPANYKLEILWVNKTTNKVESTALNDNDPTPEAVAASRIVVLAEDDVDSSSPFYDKTPLAVEVRLILWQA
ncbi:MAG: hypothetical protein ACLFVX_07905, partial [Archaeoglobaceae archaeon]